tara:strand:- start:158 stop:676 length:519 start_codon:yes stop_codon:yes gene_type:complete
MSLAVLKKKSQRFKNKVSSSSGVFSLSGNVKSTCSGTGVVVNNRPSMNYNAYINSKLHHPISIIPDNCTYNSQVWVSKLKKEDYRQSTYIDNLVSKTIKNGVSKNTMVNMKQNTCVDEGSWVVMPDKTKYRSTRCIPNYQKDLNSNSKQSSEHTRDIVSKADCGLCSTTTTT